MPRTQSSGPSARSASAGCCAVAHVLESLGRSAQRNVSAGDDSDDPIWISVERGRALGRVENAEATGGTRADVDEPAAASGARHERFDEPCEFRPGSGESVRDAAVVVDHEIDDGIDVLHIERRRTRVAPLGSECAAIGRERHGRSVRQGWKRRMPPNRRVRPIRSARQRHRSSRWRCSSDQRSEVRGSNDRARDRITPFPSGP